MAIRFGEMILRLDPWQPEFGAEAPGLNGTADELDVNVVVDVEVNEGSWAPIAPRPRPPPPQILFVDGVRRVEARIVGRSGNERFRGLFGSWAVGSVAVEKGAARFGDYQEGRVIILGSGGRLSAAFPVGPALTYDPASTSDTTPDGPIRKLHDLMRQAEEQLGSKLTNDPDVLAIIDGPLTFRNRGSAVGYVKRIAQLYLPAPQAGLLSQMSAGTRTPLFSLQGKFARYAWFVRLADPRRGDDETSGLVRMEVSDSVGVVRAVELADACTSLIPKFASVRGLHPRAPQNLLPIGALESYLRRRLGDASLINRRIQTRMAESAP